MKIPSLENNFPCQYLGVPKGGFWLDADDHKGTLFEENCENK